MTDSIDAVDSVVLAAATRALGKAVIDKMVEDAAKTSAVGLLPNGVLGSQQALNNGSSKIIYDADSTDGVSTTKVQWTNSRMILGDSDKIIVSYKPDAGVLRINTQDLCVIIEPEEIIKVALDMQKQSWKKDEDQEGEVNHQHLLDEMLQDEPSDGSIQVLDGVDDVRIENFAGSSARSLKELIAYIETNSLQEKSPWSIPWNLYRCMLLASGKT